MDSGHPMDQDNIDTLNHFSYDSFTSPDKWTDHVKWQGSQTACSALNQLIKSSAKETTTMQKAVRASEWQRVSSYDQLSNLLSTGHHDTPRSSLLSSHSRPSSSKPSSSSRSHSRTRLSETAPDITNLPIPSFFNKTNPMQFLDIMKGVSARLDENAGVRPRKEFNLGAASSSPRTKKRTRSFGGTPELQAGKATPGIPKKGRVDELLISTEDEGKGKGRVTSEDEGLDSEVRRRNLQAHSSLPDIHSRSDLKRSLSLKDVSFMDVDDKVDDMDTDHVSWSAVSSSSYHARTLSQTEMPPPPYPYAYKQRQPAADPPSTLTPLAVSRHSNSINKPQSSYPPPQQLPTNNSDKQRKPDAIPKMHPLLYNKPVATKVSSSPMATSTPQAQPQPQQLSTPIPVSEGVNFKPAPPPLGMRRNHTFPSRSSSSSVRQESSLNGKCGQLPKRQKAFKPPLLSLSQPQAGTQPRTRDLSRVKADTNLIVVEPGSTIAASEKVSSQHSPEPSSTPADTSMVLQSSTSSSESWASFQTATSSCPPPSCSHSHSSDVSDCSKSDQGMADHVAPEPPDVDTDSSFGDMSFDMDALEETMKMYD